MCRPHWRRLPKYLRDAIFQAAYALHNATSADGLREKRRWLEETHAAAIHWAEEREAKRAQMEMAL